MNKPLIMLSVAVVGALLQVGCATTSGTKTELTARELAQIKALETEVLVEKKFEVYLARGRDASTGWLLGGIFGGAIQSGMQSDADAKDTAQCQALLGDFDCQELIKTTLAGELGGAKLFSTVTPVRPAGKAEAPVPNRLCLTVHQWGLMSGGLDKTEKNALVGLTATTALTGPMGTKIWERTDFSIGGNYHRLDELKNSPELLRKEIEKALRRYCVRVVNEMRFAP